MLTELQNAREKATRTVREAGQAAEELAKRQKLLNYALSDLMGAVEAEMYGMLRKWRSTWDLSSIPFYVIPDELLKSWWQQREKLKPKRKKKS